MELTMKYDDKEQKIEVELAEMEAWLNISVEEGEPLEAREAAVQEEVNVQYNRPDYNNWHKLNRHRGMPPKTWRREDQDEDMSDGTGYLKGIAYARRQKEKESYNAACEDVRSALGKKTEWADAVIAVYLDGYTIREYAAKIGANENNITQKLKRAREKLKKFFADRQIF